MSRTVVIALDGPAGAGKSTVGERLAERLKYFYFDTGVLYRAVALRVIETGADPSDEKALERLVQEVDVVVRPSTKDGRARSEILLSGSDVSREIRTPRVDALVSSVAASPAVRRGLIDVQRRQIQGAGTIMAGRDIGTVVCPDADVKVYLDASPIERARRRLRQQGADGGPLDEVLASIERRDELDSSRALAPLARAEDAVVVATDDLSVEQVTDRIVALLRARLADSDRACST
jgi:cytidylate kinase